jgi:ZIP family zinc transporter
VISSIAALIGYAIVGGLAPQWIAAVTAFAAGAILAMLADTMIPEAFEETHNFTGLITVIGFLAAFVLSRALE